MSGPLTGAPVHVGGGTRVGSVTPVGGVNVGGGVVRPGTAASLRLDDLVDVDGVDDAPAEVPLVLEKDTDGIVRPTSAAAAGLLVDDQLGAPGGIAQLNTAGELEATQLPAAATRQPQWFRGDGPPGVVLGASLGDMYLDRQTGLLYRLD